MYLIWMQLIVYHLISKSHQLECKVGNLAAKLYPKCAEGIEHCGTKTCKPSNNHCYSIFKMENGLTFKPIHSSCWEDVSFGKDCHEGKCVLTTDDRSEMYTCCCTGNLCNANIVFPKPSSTVSTVTNSTELATTIKSHVTSTTNQHSSEKDFMYYVPPSIILMVVLTGLSFYYWLRRKRRRLGEQMLLSDYNGASVTSQASPYPALMLDVIHQGKLSVIWRGTYCQRAVAIKTISKDYADMWKTEKDLFVEHKLKHENLISFVSAERRFHENCIQYWIVTEYHENGSLAEYITKNVLSRELLLKMVYNITCGLVYLHTSYEATGKQIVAHRDLKTGNVLVKKDLSCCISDLGLAIALPERISVSRDLCQTGTKRYMAPEILQGAVSFHHESFLRADVYSMGLVFWELLSRTRLGDEEIDQYKPPYAGFVNFNPSIDEMLKCVVDNHERPPINPEWRKYQGINCIVETMKRCWDDDSDARLTSHCVKQRFKRLITSPSDDTFNLKELEKIKEQYIEQSLESSLGSQTTSLSSHTALIISDRWKDLSSIKKEDSNSNRSSLTPSLLLKDESLSSQSSAGFALTRLEKMVV